MDYAIYPFGPGAVLIQNPKYVQPQPYGFKQFRVIYGDIEGTLGICFPPHDELRFLIPKNTPVTDILNGVTGLAFTDIEEFNEFQGTYMTPGVNKEVFSHSFITADGAAEYRIDALLDAELILVLGLPSSFAIGTEVTLANANHDTTGALTFDPIPPDDINIIVVYKKAV